MEPRLRDSDPPPTLPDLPRHRLRQCAHWSTSVLPSRRICSFPRVRCQKTALCRVLHTEVVCARTAGEKGTLRDCPVPTWLASSPEPLAARLVQLAPTYAGDHPTRRPCCAAATRRRISRFQRTDGRPGDAISIWRSRGGITRLRHILSTLPASALYLPAAFAPYRGDRH